jgi:6-phosphogluconolactonase
MAKIDNRSPLEVNVFKDPYEMANYIWNQIELFNYRNIVIPGGNSIIPFYEKLNTCDLSKIEFYLCDERMAGIDNINSNQFQLKNSFNNLNVKTYGFYSENYENVLNELKKKPFISILGVGSDGHFASLFPEDADFSDSKLQRTFQKDGEPYQRMSMGFDLITQSSKIFLWIHGSSKHNIIKMLEEMNLSIPICRLVNEYKSLNLICDYKFLIG